MAIVITADEKVIALGKAGADIIFLMDKKGVEEDDQAKLYHIGVVSVELFSVFARDQADLEKILDSPSWPYEIRAFITDRNIKHCFQYEGNPLLVRITILILNRKRYTFS